MDVARVAGVSHQTVSRVLNGHPSVRDSTRAAVLAAIKDLDYRRNLAARALVTGRTHTLGVVSLDTTLYGPASMLFGIEQAARAAGYFVTIASLRTIDRASVLDALDRLRSQAVDGIIVIAPQATAHALAGLPDVVPVVAIGGSDTDGVPTVAVDQHAGAAAATAHLLDRGHATVWHVAGPGDWVEAQLRTAAWQQTLERAGAEVHPPLPGDWSARSGYEAGLLLAKIPDVTAVFAANDHMALGILRALNEAGRQVPADVSLVGFDDIPEAAYFSPPLTTVRQDFGELGRRSLALLVDRIGDADTGVPRENVPAKLVIRESVGEPS